MFEFSAKVGVVHDTIDDTQIFIRDDCAAIAGINEVLRGKDSKERGQRTYTINL